MTKYIKKAKNHLELIDITLTDILSAVKDKAPSDSQAENIVNFVQLIPSDMSLKFFQEGASLVDNFIPIVLVLSGKSTNPFTLNMIEAMGYPEGAISENIEKLDKIVNDYEKQIAEKK